MSDASGTSTNQNASSSQQLTPPAMNSTPMVVVGGGGNAAGGTTTNTTTTASNSSMLLVSHTTNTPSSMNLAATTTTTTTMAEQPSSSSFSTLNLPSNAPSMTTATPQSHAIHTSSSSGTVVVPNASLMSMAPQRDTTSSGTGSSSHTIHHTSASGGSSNTMTNTTAATATTTTTTTTATATATADEDEDTESVVETPDTAEQEAERVKQGILDRLRKGRKAGSLAEKILLLKQAAASRLDFLPAAFTSLEGCKGRIDNLLADLDRATARQKKPTSEEVAPLLYSLFELFEDSAAVAVANPPRATRGRPSPRKAA